MAKHNNKVIELNVSIFKNSGLEFTGEEAGEFMAMFEAFLKTQGYDYGGGHELL